MRILPTLAFLLSSCTPPPTISMACPILITYTAQEQKELALELTKTPHLKEVPRWLEDYIGLRDQVRACKEEPP